MVEFWPSKPAVRVRSPSPAPKDYVVTIAERIHLFPFRTQKLSSLALMVLGGKLPGRVGRSHVKCSKVAQRWSNRLLTGRLWVRAPPLEPKKAEVAELADAQDLKSCGTYLSYRFDSGLRHL